MARARGGSARLLIGSGRNVTDPYKKQPRTNSHFFRRLAILEYMTNERRSAARISHHGEAIVYVRDRKLDCKIMDLSSTGMLIVPPVSARPGLPMRIDFLIPGAKEWVSATAALVREGRAEGHYAWGVRFDRVAPYHATMLRSFVRQMLRGDDGSRSSSSSRLNGHAHDAVRESKGRRDTASAASTSMQPYSNSHIHTDRSSPTTNDRETYRTGPGHQAVASAIEETLAGADEHQQVAIPRLATDPFADLPIRSNRQVEPEEDSSSVERSFKEDDFNDDWSDDSANLKRLYMDAIEDVRSKSKPIKEPKRKTRWKFWDRDTN